MYATLVECKITWPYCVIYMYFPLWRQCRMQHLNSESPISYGDKFQACNYIFYEVTITLFLMLSTQLELLLMQDLRLSQKWLLNVHSSEIQAQRRVVRWDSTDVPGENVALIFRTVCYVLHLFFFCFAFPSFLKLKETCPSETSVISGLYDVI